MTSSAPGSLACRICSTACPKVFEAREMMYGLREKFSYFECISCGCVQISQYPTDMARYYPTDYYAYAPPAESAQQSVLARLKSALRRKLLDQEVIRNVWLGLPSNRDWIAKRPLLQFYIKQFRNPSTRMLDVGCGAGELLRYLRNLGFGNVEGVDPYIGADVVYDGRTLVWKRHLADMTPGYQCISFHHSLEHMPDQATVLTDTRRLLAPGGIILIRIPMAGTAAWRTYKENWVQLDPPRHFYLHSQASLKLLAEQCDLVVDSIVCDSKGFQFWGSELYLKDVPLLDERSPARGSNAIYSSEELEEYDNRADDLNEQNDGDQAMIVLRMR